MPTRTMSSHKQHECRTQTASSPHVRVDHEDGWSRQEHVDPTDYLQTRTHATRARRSGRGGHEKQRAETGGHRATYHRGNWRPAAETEAEASVWDGSRSSHILVSKRSMTMGAGEVQQAPSQAASSTNAAERFVPMCASAQCRRLDSSGGRRPSRHCM